MWPLSPRPRQGGGGVELWSPGNTSLPRAAYTHSAPGPLCLLLSPLRSVFLDTLAPALSHLLFQGSKCSHLAITPAFTVWKTSIYPKSMALFPVFSTGAFTGKSA